MEVNVSLYCGDFLDLDVVKEGSVDFIFADPPYLLSNGGTTVQNGKRSCVDKGIWDKSKGSPEQDYEFHNSWINKCKKLLKENGILAISGTFHSIYYCGNSLLSNDWRIVNDICWYKPNASPNIGCRCFTHSHETILVAVKKECKRYFFDYSRMKQYNTERDVFKNDNKQMRDCWSIPTPSKKEKEFGKYPTQKPLELLMRLVMAFSDKDSTILDPFCGSGTTAVATSILGEGRSFIGFDMNEDAINLTRKRLSVYNEIKN